MARFISVLAWFTRQNVSPLSGIFSHRKYGSSLCRLSNTEWITQKHTQSLLWHAHSDPCCYVVCRALASISCASETTTTTRDLATFKFEPKVLAALSLDCLGTSSFRRIVSAIFVLCTCGLRCCFSVRMLYINTNVLCVHERSQPAKAHRRTFSVCVLIITWMSTSPKTCAFAGQPTTHTTHKHPKSCGLTPCRQIIIRTLINKNESVRFCAVFFRCVCQSNYIEISSHIRWAVWS